MQASSDVYTSKVSDGRAVIGVVGAWLLAATLFTASGRLGSAPVYALPLLIGSLTSLAVVFALVGPGSARWVSRLSLASLALFHLWRVVPGVAFLLLYRQGALPWDFAGPAGVGDIAVGITAPLAAWASARPGPASRAGYLTWNVLGLVDLLNAVRAAFLLTLAAPVSMHLLRELPLGLLPTFAVPLTLAVHLIGFRRDPLRT